MDINTVSLKLEKLHSGHIQIKPVNREMIEDARQAGEKVWPRMFILTEPEVRDAIKCARGEVEYRPWYDDIGHLVRVGQHGISEIYLNSAGVKGGKYENHTFIMPGSVLAGWLENILEDGALQYEYGEDVFTQLGEEYGPKWRYVFDGGVCEELLKDLGDERQTRLQDCLDSFIRIATNYSDGVEVDIHLWFDHTPRPDCPTSYMFDIQHPTGRVMYGGLIAHRVSKDGVELNEWQYSTHT